MRFHYGDDAVFICGYEVGCLGFTLYHQFSLAKDSNCKNRENKKEVDVTYSHSYANFSILEDYVSNIINEILFFSCSFCFFVDSIRFFLFYTEVVPSQNDEAHKTSSKKILEFS